MESLSLHIRRTQFSSDLVRLYGHNRGAQEQTLNTFHSLFSLMSFITAFELSKLFCMTTGNIKSLKHSSYLHYTTSQSYPGFMPATSWDATVNINAKETINNWAFCTFFWVIKKVMGVLIKCGKKLPRCTYPEAQF